MNRFSTIKLWLQLSIVMGIAVVVRGIYWLVTPAANAGDSHMFLDIAQAILRGEIATALEFPFHITYSLLLVPGFIIPGGLAWYIPLLHIVLSAIASVLLYLISREITSDHRVHALTAITGICYPHLLWWMKYILTEVVFIPILAAFIYLTIKLLQKSSNLAWALWPLFAVLLLFTRPVSLLVLMVSVVSLLAALMRRKFPQRWLSITIALVVVGVILGVGSISIPAINQRLLNLPTVAQSLWLSTRMVSGTYEDYYEKAALPPEVIQKTPAEQSEYKIDNALDFIRTQPLQYGLMAVKRFFNYYFPWTYPQWSLRHRIFDAVLSLSLTLAALASFEAPANKQLMLFLIACVLALGVTTAFSQIDTDGRYRLPAEALIIPVSSVGMIYMLEKIFRFEKWAY